jgi:hypothetical protein
MHTSTAPAAPQDTAIAALRNAAVGDAPPISTDTVYATSGTPRWPASSSELMKPGGGMMPSMSAGRIPASLIASIAASRMSSQTWRSLPRT